MSKTVSELAQELGVSRQYLNRILSQNNLGRKKGNKKVVSDMDEKVLISILEGNIGNQKTETKTETKTLVSNMSLSSSEIRNCAKLPVKMLLIKTSNRLCRLVCLSVIERQFLGREIYELHGCKNAEDESWQFGRSF
ncbi:hypothetical protein [Streptococcus mutans]|uniref:hypothetical protein n=1 Tax=Streptococcus mutans TaxID=1309 RepID=UPI0012A9C840|nr:hypothetical protein [Streptococcus mutans]QFG42102.1 hypothetical protein FSA40_2048 [Streptococcus mutans]QFG42115.1 hypothetical protein FSA40_2061 [Streptococcus mutans]